MPVVINGDSVHTTQNFLDTSVASVTSGFDTTYSATDVVGGIIERDSGLVGRSDTFPSAANLVAEMKTINSTCGVGSSFQLTLLNSGSLGTITLNAGTGNTLVGKTRIQPSRAGNFIIRITSDTLGLEGTRIYSLSPFA